MRSSRIPILAAAALFILCFSLAAYLDGPWQKWPGNRAQSDNVLAILIGDGRRLFANHFFSKADAYYHSGFYPTIFDNREAFNTPHVAADTGTVEENNHGDDKGFLGKPRDWIDGFSRQFFPSHHTHLDEGGASGHDDDKPELVKSGDVREILPWLKLSAEMDPNEIRTYTTAAYWLRDRMGKPDEAEQFLREGLRGNPGSYEILFELGRVYAENRGDVNRAVNIWKLALKNWDEQESRKKEPDNFFFQEITARLARWEARQGDYTHAIEHMEMWKTRAPHPEEIQKQIDALRLQQNAPPGAH
jgi:tetratricopeptide (TPR) repeat protein